MGDVDAQDEPRKSKHLTLSAFARRRRGRFHGVEPRTLALHTNQEMLSGLVAARSESVDVVETSRERIDAREDTLSAFGRRRCVRFEDVEPGAATLRTNRQSLEPSREPLHARREPRTEDEAPCP